MTTADSYRNIAVELKAKAEKERSQELASDLKNLALCYLRLAEQAEANRLLDMSAKLGPKNRLGEGEGRN
jgi:hypothetical protein